ncbi:MAG: isoleucine--tRNA ligase [Candidatus Kapaibacterium sp.]
MFKELPNNISYPELEESVLKFWEEKQIFEKSLDLRAESKSFTFYEGPPTVNGKPGIHHMMARTIKDTVCRYKTMQGYFVRRQAGWDTHGLPVEIQAEKELGITNKSEVETIGIGKFNAACKDLVYKNIEMDEGWRTLTRRMGYWVDLDTAYITCTNNYIESVWWALKQLFDKELIFKGFKVVPQSPTIETPLSSHELSLGYKEVKDFNCYIKLKVTNAKIKGTEGAELLVWTTTPWTLFSNVALAVGVNIDYVLVKNTRKIKEEVLVDNIILAKDRLETLDGEYEIIDSFKGHELLGTKYEQIFPYLDLKENEHSNALSIIEGDFVSTEDGSGIVHLAPAFGEDDYRLSLEYNLPFVQPVTPSGHLTEELGPFAGRAIKDFEYEDRKEVGVETDVVIALKIAGKIYRSQKDYLHNYPHCWRTGNPIMYYARESWFIKSPAYKERMIALNKEINWQPKEIGEGRFGNWLEEVKDWSLSRDRFWGTPLPLWINENDETDIIAVGSIEDLKKGKFEKEDGTLISIDDCGQEIDLHRPFVDSVVFEKNGNKYRRTHEVIDAWFDSGSMPFAQMHYPFENKELFDKSFPADFIEEGIDQTRGWFYTLHNIATAIFDKPAYKNIVVNELILDKNGVKMSKRLGNTIDPFEIMNSLGADAVRWYLFVNNPPWNTTKFDSEGISRVVIADFFRSLTQTYNFFSLYANIDKFDVNREEVPMNERPEIDKWIISRANTIAKEYIRLMDEYELTKAHRLIQEFTINELSNWYIRRNRRRFWKGENDNDKLSAYQTLRRVFVRILQLTASAAPFLSEDLYQRLKKDSEPLSIHLTDFMDVNEDAIDTVLEERMDVAQRIVYLARSLREKSQIKTRQPLQKILIPVLTPQFRRNIEQMASIIKEELNIKEIEYMTDSDSDIIKRNVRPDFRNIGAKYGKQTNMVAQEVKKFGDKEIAQLLNEGSITLNIDENEFILDDNDVEIYNEDIEGWLVANEKNITVALDTTITPELKNEGIAREFVSRIQNIRKDSGFEVTDRIKITTIINSEFDNAISNMLDYIKTETLADEITSNEVITECVEIEIDDLKLKIIIEKI